MNPYERLRLLAKKQGLSINDVEEKRNFTTIFIEHETKRSSYTYIGITL